MFDVSRIPPAPESPLSFAARIRMRDGILLAGGCLLARRAGRRPTQAPGDTILIRLPYDKSGVYTFIPQVAEYFMQHGYRVVAQDVRGKFRSEGDALLFVNEVDDGYDTIEWITQQSWSNGRVAMWGDSYYGYTQWAAAASGHPALKAISPRLTGTALGEPVRRDPDSAHRRCRVGRDLHVPPHAVLRPRHGALGARLVAARFRSSGRGIHGAGGMPRALV